MTLGKAVDVRCRIYNKDGPSSVAKALNGRDGAAPAVRDPLAVGAAAVLLAGRLRATGEGSL